MSVLSYIKNEWNLIFSEWYKVSFTKNWTTKIFLKVIFYLCVWILSLKIVALFVYNNATYSVSGDAWVEYISSFFHSVDFDYNFNSYHNEECFDTSFLDDEDLSRCDMEDLMVESSHRLYGTLEALNNNEAFKNQYFDGGFKDFLSPKSSKLIEEDLHNVNDFNLLSEKIAVKELYEKGVSQIPVNYLSIPNILYDWFYVDLNNNMLTKQVPWYRINGFYSLNELSWDYYIFEHTFNLMNGHKVFDHLDDESFFQNLNDLSTSYVSTTERSGRILNFMRKAFQSTHDFYPTAINHGTTGDFWKPEILGNNYLNSYDWSSYVISHFLSSVGIFINGLVSVLIILIFFFIVLHIYFTLNSVFKDYVRDISVPLHFIYFFLSIFLLVNVLIIFHDIYLFREANGPIVNNIAHTYLHNDTVFTEGQYFTPEYTHIFKGAKLNLAGVDSGVYNREFFDNFYLNNKGLVSTLNTNISGFNSFISSFLILQSYTLNNILLFTILYIVVYLIINFVLGKGFQQFKILFNYVVIFLVSAFIFVNLMIFLLAFFEYTLYSEYIIDLSETVKFNFFSGGAFYMDTYKLAYDIGYWALSKLYLIEYALFNCLLFFINLSIFLVNFIIEPSTFGNTAFEFLNILF